MKPTEHPRFYAVCRNENLIDMMKPRKAFEFPVSPENRIAIHAFSFQMWRVVKKSKWAQIQTLVMEDFLQRQYTI